MDEPGDLVTLKKKRLWKKVKGTTITEAYTEADKYIKKIIRNAEVSEKAVERAR
jgi:hypothetical protein